MRKLPPIVDLTGKVIGRLTVLGLAQRQPVKWRCMCECGNESTVKTSDLNNGNTTSCGCRQKEIFAQHYGKVADMTGKKYGRLTPIRISDRKTSEGRIVWECLCDCGNTAYASQKNLHVGKKKSCGCLQRESQSASGKKLKGIWRNFNDLSGKTFGYLAVLERAECGDGRVNYLCRCLLCGGLTVKNGYYLTKGRSKSCGCLRSNGEQRLSELLSAREIIHERDKGFSDCRGHPTEKKKTGLKLRFDFVIYDKQLIAGIIEYDGIGHFEPSFNRKNITTFEQTLERDQIKNDYCHEKGIPLLRIKYTEFARIEEITDKFLSTIFDRE